MEDYPTFLIIPIGMALYLIPSMIGWKKRNADAIVAINVLLGWTFIGWFVALIWALTVDPPIPRPPATKTETIKKLKDLFDSGALTEAEYNNEKQKILNQ